MKVQGTVTIEVTGSWVVEGNNSAATIQKIVDTVVEMAARTFAEHTITAQAGGTYFEVQ